VNSEKTIKGKKERKIILYSETIKHISSSAARSTFIASQVSNAFMTQNPKSTKLNTLFSCQS